MKKGCITSWPGLLTAGGLGGITGGFGTSGKVTFHILNGSYGSPQPSPIRSPQASLGDNASFVTTPNSSA